MMNNLATSDIKTFIGSKDYELSLDFYTKLGWTLNFNAGDIAELELGSHRFYLQKYYQKEWCHNSMLHITVEDAAAWYEHVKEILRDNKYGTARVTAPEMQDYGALVTFVWDPAGVLLHFAQPVPNSE
jgi:catechol 2,3-dioxygenase-like lactoylglutathione lyase family enzyme